ncbi:MAG: NAD-dependent deacetylase [Porticoccus sp.]|jgi:NAD-dependent deacetylase
MYQMHGELLKIRCSQSGDIFECKDSTLPQCHCCHIAGSLRPYIVWFGEMPLFRDDIYPALSNCDLFIAIGTPGNVYPATGFCELAKREGAHTVELNLEPTINSSKFEEQRYGPRF